MCQLEALCDLLISYRCIICDEHVVGLGYGAAIWWINQNCMYIM